MCKFISVTLSEAKGPGLGGTPPQMLPNPSPGAKLRSENDLAFGAPAGQVGVCLGYF